jgi:hypothetical protein
MYVITFFFNSLICKYNEVYVPFIIQIDYRVDREQKHYKN